MRSLIAILLLSIPSIASAQDSLPVAGEAMNQPTADEQAQKVREMSFGDGEDVTGNLIKPNESGLMGEVHGKTNSLIKVRSSFVGEILKSTDDV